MILFNADLVNKKVKQNIPTDKKTEKGTAGVALIERFLLLLLLLSFFFFFFFCFFHRVTPFIILNVISLLGCAVKTKQNKNSFKPTLSFVCPVGISRLQLGQSGYCSCHLGQIPASRAIAIINTAYRRGRDLL